MADTTQDQEILEYLAELQKTGLQITNTEGMTAWFKDKTAKGATLKDIKRSLKENDYDFKKVDELLKEKEASKSALKKVTELETKIKTEEQKKKEQSQLQLIITAFTVAAVSAGSAWFISRQTADIDTSIVGETGGILATFIKAGWIAGIAAGFVGLLLATMFISEKLKHKSVIPKKEADTKEVTQKPEQKAI